MRAATLERELRNRGLTCHVEERDRLAILTPNGELPSGESWRPEVVRIARELGFTHVALELLSA